MLGWLSMRRALLVLVLVVFAGCGSRKPNAVRLDPALATLVPSDTILLVGARLDALRSTPLYRKLGAGAAPGLLGGLDIDNVWELLAASNGRDTAVMARGKFATATGQEPEIARPGATRTPYKGYALVGLGDSAVLFMNPTMAIVGTPAALRGIIDQRGVSTGPPAPLAAELDAIPPETQLWAAGAGPRLAAIVPRAGNAANLANVFKLIDRFHAAADLRSGARIDAVALCPSDRDAESLAGAVNALAAFAGLGRRGVALRVTQQQAAVRVEGTVPEEVIESFLPH